MSTDSSDQSKLNDEDDPRIPAYLWEYLNEKVGSLQDESVDLAADQEPLLMTQARIEEERLRARRELLAEILGVIALHNTLDGL